MNYHHSRDDEDQKITKRTLRQPIVYVGYTRVSTKKQEQYGISLAAQADMHRGYVAQHNGLLLNMYQDGQSAYGSKAKSRLGLQAAIQECIATGAELLVTRVDRLSRSLNTMKELDVPGLKIVSITEGRVTKKTLRILIEAAQRQSDETSRRAKEAAARSKARGKRLGNPRNLPEAQRLGTLATVRRKELKVDNLADFIDVHPQMLTMTSKRRVDLLNTAGQFNLRGASSLVPWTQGALRKPWKDALEHLEKRRQIDALDTVSPAGSNHLALPDQTGVAHALEASVLPVDAHHSATARLPQDNPPMAASQGPSRELSATASGGLASAPGGSAIMREEPMSAPPLGSERSGSRSLTAGEIQNIHCIMNARGLSRCDVMDELGLPRLDASLWMSCRNGTKVRDDMLQRLGTWLAANEVFFAKAA